MSSSRVTSRLEVLEESLHEVQELLDFSILLFALVIFRLDCSQLVVCLVFLWVILWVSW